MRPKKVFLSIIMPTYNKDEELEATIASILTQTFKNYELIISDNNSKDNTEKVVKSCKDKRIRYYRNKTNIGWIKNIEKTVNKAKGEYVLLQGDDDPMISNNCISKLFKITEIKKYGFIRLNYTSNKDGILFDFKKNKSFLKDYSVRKNRSNSEIIDFIVKADPYFLTGICFKNTSEHLDFLDSELSPWFKILFTATKMDGAIFVSKYFFKAKWVSKKAHPFYIVKNKKFLFESYLDEISKLISLVEFELFKKNFFRQVISLFPLAKLNYGNKNLVKCGRRIIQVKPSYKYSLYFWLYLFISFFSPVFALRLLREFSIARLINKNRIKIYK